MKQHCLRAQELVIVFARNHVGHNITAEAVLLIWYDIIYDIYIFNRSWVDTRWQQLFVIHVQMYIFWIATYNLTLHVSLTVHQSISVQWNQRDALCIQFIKKYWPLHVSSITCSSPGGTTQTALGIMRACYVSWLYQDGVANWRNTQAI
jgi:hypothetical protein